MHSIPLLEVVRRRTRHAWLLHAWMILALLLMPAGRLARADGEGGFVQTGTESSVAVNVWAPEGTAGMQTGNTRQVITHVDLNTWEVWTHSETGAIEYRNPLTVALAGAGVTFSTSGTGFASPSDASTDNSGNALTTFTMGSSASTVTATVTAYGATGSVTFDTPVIPETWTWDHDERLISASLSTTDSPDSVPAGATREIQAHVDVTTWPVEVSNLGNMRMGDPSTSPAIGAQVMWSVETGGSGSVGGTSTTDSTGNAGATFTMGAAASVVRAEVSYASSSATYATLGFTPAPVTETWSLDRTEYGNLAFSLSANGNLDGLAPGEQRTVTASGSYTSYEVWVSNLGNEVNQNYTTFPSAGMIVAFSRDYGDGSMSSTIAYSDGLGNASVNFTMGNTASRLSASAYAGSANANLTGVLSATIDFNPVTEVWAYDRMASTLSFSTFTANGSVNDLRPGNTRTLTADVVSNTVEVWVSNHGNTEYRNPSSGPASDVTVGFSITAGNGTVSSGSVTTDGMGHASTGFTMASQSSTVQADVNDGANGTITTTITLGFGEPVWTHVRNETTIATTLTADGTTDGLPPGITRTVTANVTFNTWQVWMDDAGNIESKNPNSGAANGASIWFYVTQGDGTIMGAASSTDSNGNATAFFTMGSQTSIVQADASYAGADSSGTITFTPDPWHYDHPGGPVLAMALNADEATSTVTATMTVTTWEVWTDGTNYEDRNITTGPAGGAYVTFAADGDVTVDTSFGYTDTAGNASTGYTCPDGGEGTITVEGSFMSATKTAWVLIQKVAEPPPPPPPPGQWVPKTEPKAYPNDERYKITISWQQWEEDANPDVPKKFRLLRLKWTVPADDTDVIRNGWTSVTFAGITVTSNLWFAVGGPQNLPDGVGMIDKAGNDNAQPAAEPSELYWKEKRSNETLIEELKTITLDFHENMIGPNAGVWDVKFEVQAK